MGLIKPYDPIPTDAKICESKLYKKDNHCWLLDLVVERYIPEKLHYQNVIGINMGIKHIATSVELASGKTRFWLGSEPCSRLLFLAETKIGHEEGDRHDKDNRKP